MEKKEFDFCQDHSLHYLEMAFSLYRRKIINNPDGYGKRTGECGDTIEIFLTVRNDRIQSVAYDTDGCMNINACANTVAYMAEGKSIEQAWEITPENVVDYLETLPHEKAHCAELSVGVFYLALTNFRELEKAPWKKLYRRK
ncbi:iron-sulfur cluster assembly scaffold protein [Thermodesulfobacteriota bacterium]